MIDASPTTPAPRATRLIATDGVAKRYGAVQALDGVTVEIEERATGLLGANGAGKSTLMKALLGLVEPDAGTVEVLGIDAAQHPGEIRRRLGYMPELDCLPLDMTARDLVVHMAELRGLPRRAAVLRASEVLFQVGLEEERSRLIRTFSTGMKQRTKLAQAIVHAPELVVLDEPTNGLDPSGRDEMLSLVRRLSSDLGIAVLLELARPGGRHAHLRRGGGAARRAPGHGRPHRRHGRAHGRGRAGARLGRPRRLRRQPHRARA